MKKKITILLFLFISICCFSQIEDIEVQEDLIESIIENLEGDEEFDFNTLYEELTILLENPININDCTDDELKQILFLNDIQINDLLSYRSQLGNFISLHELQSLHSWDLKTIKNVTPFITLNESLDDYHLPLVNLLTGGKNEIYLKWRRVMEDQIGYDPDRVTSSYEGDPNRYYLRFRHYYENKFRIGILAEKDAGESFFSGSNPNGFDFYSGHIHLREYRKWLEDIILGDYTVSLGQGLILHNDFGSSKSSYVMDLKKGGRVLKSYNSINEVNFFRGAATQINISDNLNVTLFGSKKFVDGNSFIDTTENELGFEAFSSLSTSGYHRTESEIGRKRTIGQFNTGGRLEFRGDSHKIGLNGLYTRFDKSFQRNIQLYNQFSFSGEDLYNVSFDASYRYRNFNFFSEVAVSDNGGVAQLFGLLAGLDRRLDASVLYRNYDRDYQALNSNAFGETTGTNNEQGIYLGIIVRPHNYWTVSAYSDIWKHPWLRFRRDAPSNGKEYLVRLEHYRKRQYNFYLQYKYEEKRINSSADVPIDFLTDFILQRVRAHVNYDVTKSLELRNRVEFSWLSKDGRNSNGFMAFQDVIYRPIGSKFSFTARYALFDTGDCDKVDCETRIYAYENDLIYEFFIPFFQNRGKRYYTNLRYDASRNLTLEFRFARTVLENKDEIGSGLELINGNVRTELKAQLRYQF